MVNLEIFMWYSIRGIIQFKDKETGNVFEEVIAVIQACNEEQALQYGRQKFVAYSLQVEGHYTGYCDSYEVCEDEDFDEEIKCGFIFSQMRSTKLETKDYLDRFFDSGSEHARREY
jgi:hypothetical protein